MDCQMPDMDGFATTRNIREKEKGTGRRVPIVAVTAHAMEGDRTLCLQSGMDDYLSKPVNPDKFHEIVYRWLNLAAPVQKSQGPGPAAGNAGPVDFSVMGAIAGGDPEQEKKMVRMFIRTGEETLKELEASVGKAGTHKAWRSAAHRLKGSSAQMGATALCGKCAAAEEPGLSDEEKQNLLRNIALLFEETRDSFKKRTGLL